MHTHILCVCGGLPVVLPWPYFHLCIDARACVLECWQLACVCMGVHEYLQLASMCAFMCVRVHVPLGHEAGGLCGHVAGSPSGWAYLCVCVCAAKSTQCVLQCVKPACTM